MFWVMSNPQIVIYTSDHGFGHAVPAAFLAEVTAATFFAEAYSTAG